MEDGTVQTQARFCSWPPFLRNSTSNPLVPNFVLFLPVLGNLICYTVGAGQVADSTDAHDGQAEPRSLEGVAGTQVP